MGKARSYESPGHCREVKGVEVVTAHCIVREINLIHNNKRTKIKRMMGKKKKEEEKKDGAEKLLRAPAYL